VGKPKGMFDVAYERGLLDLKTYYYHQFSVQGALSDTGSRIDKTSLASLLSKCDDFLNEETMLQQTMKKLGATLVRTPKYHCKIAGEGVEYGWGNAKMMYRRTPYKNRDTKKKFLIVLKDECLHRKNLDEKRIRLNSKRARDYIYGWVFYLSI